MPQKNERKCTYTKCMIPKNNNKYLAQLVFLIIAYAALTVDKKQFTLAAVMIYVVPISVDLLFCQTTDKVCRGICNFAKIYNIIIIIVCVAGFMGALTDQGNSFSISTMYITGTVSKTVCGLFLLADILVPYVFWKTCPNVQQIEASKKINQTLSRSKT